MRLGLHGDRAAESSLLQNICFLSEKRSLRLCNQLTVQESWIRALLTEQYNIRYYIRHLHPNNKDLAQELVNTNRWWSICPLIRNRKPRALSILSICPKKTLCSALLVMTIFLWCVRDRGVMGSTPSFPTDITLPEEAYCRNEGSIYWRWGCPRYS